MISSGSVLENVTFQPVHYVELEVLLPCDVLTTVGMLAEAGLSDTMVCYEDNDSWSIGIGEAASIVTTCSNTILNCQGTCLSWQAGEPIDSIQQAFAAVPYVDWKAYGMANFALARTHYGLNNSHAEQELMRFIIPKYEVRIANGMVLLRAIDEQKLDRLANLMSTIIELEASGQLSFERRIAKQAFDVKAIEEHGAAAFYNNVSAALDEIAQQQYQKVILSRFIHLDKPVDMVASYIHGRRSNTPARSFLLKIDGFEAAGYSPETVVVVDDEGWVSTRPLAGTRSLGATKAEEQVLKQSLLSDHKEVYEHAISARLAVEELMQVCDSESVNVHDFMAVVRRNSVQHLASKVRGRLTEKNTAWHALKSLFPGVTASGIPKKQAIDAIGRLEQEPRGLYSGCVLTIDSKGKMDAAIVLRSVFQQNGTAHVRVGAGIVKGSCADREMEETREKVRSIARYLVTQ